jgi:hypothetical protein
MNRLDPQPTHTSGAALVAKDDLRLWEAALAVLDPVTPLLKQQDQSKPARQGRISNVLESLQVRFLRADLVRDAYKRWEEIEAKPDASKTPGEEYFVSKMALYECRYALLHGNTNSESTKTLKEMLDALQRGALPPPKPPSPPPVRAIDKPNEKEQQRMRWKKQGEEHQKALERVVMRSARAPLSAPPKSQAERSSASCKRPIARTPNGASVAALLANAGVGPALVPSDVEVDTETQDLLGGPEPAMPRGKRPRVLA